MNNKEQIEAAIKNIETILLEMVDAGVAPYPNHIQAEIDTIQQSLAQPASAEKVCKWTRDEDNEAVGVCYKTECGNLHYFPEGGIQDNEYKFCPYCGGKIVEVKR